MTAVGANPSGNANNSAVRISIGKVNINTADLASADDGTPASAGRKKGEQADSDNKSSDDKQVVEEGTGKTNTKQEVIKTGGETDSAQAQTNRNILRRTSFGSVANNLRAQEARDNPETNPSNNTNGTEPATNKPSRTSRIFAELNNPGLQETFRNDATTAANRYGLTSPDQVKLPGSSATPGDQLALGGPGGFGAFGGNVGGGPAGAGVGVGNNFVNGNVNVNNNFGNQGNTQIIETKNLAEPTYTSPPQANTDPQMKPTARTPAPGED